MNRYQISSRQIDIFVTGALDPNILNSLFETIARDRGFRCDLKQFWHFEAVDCANFQLASLPALGLALDEDRAEPYPQVAFIADTDLLFGLCRVYAGWVGGKPIDVGVFRSYDDALAWAYPADESQRSA